MYRKGLGLVLIFSLFCFPIFAEEESITTYYPSPYGSYNELKTNKMTIGDTGPPDTPGVMRFEGRGSNPAGVNDAQAGALYYNNSTQEFRYYNGSTWKQIGAGARTIRGVVNADGSVAAGSGFTVSKLGAGEYRITFTTAFGSIPSAVVLPKYKGSAGSVASYTALSSTSFDVFIALSGASLPSDHNFSFIVSE